MKHPALFINGKVVTGTHHGDAFSKLTDEERECCLTSGFLDSVNGKFIGDDGEFYLKKIIMIRHADIDSYHNNPGINEKGRKQSEQAAFAIFEKFNCEEFTGFTSPLKRCQETAALIAEKTKIHFSILPELRDQEENENIIDFLARIKHTLNTIPEKSILVSHCNCIANLVQFASGNDMNDVEIPKCSIVYVENNEILWISK